MSSAKILGALVILAVIVTVGVSLWVSRDNIVPYLRAEQCVASVNERTTALDLEQSENAGLISGISVGRIMPARAASIALATAYQESKIRNIDFGDRDSLGLFQQRPSQGWGTADQIQDPVYATHAFYDGLSKIEGYETMAITVAAQAVQRSGFPDAYADHEDDARVLASALTGHSPRAFTCQIDEPSEGRLRQVAPRITEAFGTTVSPPTVAGREVRTAVPTRERGWAVAHFLVSQADGLGITQVSYRGWQWQAGSDGWTKVDNPREQVVAVVAG